MAHLYFEPSVALRANFTVYNVSDSLSRLYCVFNPNQLLFSREDGSSEFTAEYIVAYDLYPSFDSKELLDSGSFQFSYNKKEKLKEVIKSCEIKTISPGNYLLEASIFDVKRRQLTRSFINLTKSENYTRQDFLVSSQVTDKVCFSNTLHGKNQISIEVNNPKIHKLQLSYFKKKFPIALPPFSVKPQTPISYGPDSIAVLSSKELNEKGIQLRKEGIYHFQVDSSSKDGLTLFRYQNNFPVISQVDQMMGPLRYITTKQEYSEMVMKENKKLAIDDFWLKITGTTERGKKVIKKFYTRVQLANKNFSSYKEGWKSDRGMVYIIYGPPDVVYKNNFSESWIYGEEGNLISLNFTFVKIRNPFTDNDFSLDRSPIYKNSWYLAVDAWRQGIIY
jgi:GWxTD domain-containing protein